MTTSHSERVCDWCGESGAVPFRYTRESDGLHVYFCSETCQSIYHRYYLSECWKFWAQAKATWGHYA